MLAQAATIAMTAADERVCPQCQTRHAAAALEQRQYRCVGCGLELAHLDIAANGAVRGIFGWVLNLGTLVHDRYQVVGVLGKGGFGITYLVDDMRLAGKRRALKEIPALLFDEYETRLLGRLNHRAIPDIIDRCDADGMVYLVLEFGGNRTLRLEMERQGGRIPVVLLLPWIEQVCDALIYLHSQDPPIIHRDLKPENILLDDHDQVMLIDFGVAKESVGDNVTRTLGRAVTHGFSPPEQVLGTGTDARSDVYALGAILYCAVTGRVPPAAHQRITGTVLEPPSRLAPEVPPLLDAAICQALELNLHNRQQTIAELAQCLTLLRSGDASARTVSAVDSTAMTAGLRVPEAVHLARVEFPSLRQSQRIASAPSVREQPPVALEPPPPRAWTWVGIGLAGVILAGGGWLYRHTADQGPAGRTPANLVAPVSVTAPPVKPVSDLAPPAATVPVGTLPASAATPAATPVAAPEHPVQVPPPPAPVPVPSIPPPTESAPPMPAPAPERPPEAVAPPPAPAKSLIDELRDAQAVKHGKVPPVAPPEHKPVYRAAPPPPSKVRPAIRTPPKRYPLPSVNSPPRRQAQRSAPAKAGGGYTEKQLEAIRKFDTIKKKP